jgi:putative nucleotidyltransferase with HDIG domain
MVQLVSKLVDAREPYARGHSGRVAAFAAATAKALGLAAAEVEAVTIAGRLHDVGKIGIPADILLKHGPLTAEEDKKIRAHPLLGERLLAKVRIPADILSMIRHHHEAFNGRGYPDGLAGERIPLGARIIAVANAFDVLTSSGETGRELSHEEAFTRLLAQAGNELDPAVVHAFTDAWQHPRFEAESTSPKPGSGDNETDFWEEENEEGW